MLEKLMAKNDLGPRLGRGLASLLGDAGLGEAGLADAGASQAMSRAAIQAIPVELLEPSPFQPRTRVDPAALEELAASIRAKGILQPLLARPHPTASGRYQIVAGERRWRAA